MIDSSLRDIIEREYDKSIDDKRAKLVLQSYYKYGSARDNFGSGRGDALASADLCIEKFKKTRNTEYLMDAMNYLMFRIMFPMDGDHFEYTGSDGSAGTVGTPINMEEE